MFKVYIYWIEVCSFLKEILVAGLSEANMPSARSANFSTEFTLLSRTYNFDLARKAHLAVNFPCLGGIPGCGVTFLYLLPYQLDVNFLPEGNFSASTSVHVGLKKPLAAKIWRLMGKVTKNRHVYVLTVWIKRRFFPRTLSQFWLLYIAYTP